MSDPGSEGRRSLFQSYAKKFGWRVEFWPAVDGRQLTLAEFPSWVVPGGKRGSTCQPLTGSEVGLLRSTRSLLLEAVERDLDYLVVFEDDAIIFSPPRLRVPPEFDIVFFNGGITADTLGRVTGGCGAFGYLLTRRGVHLVLKLLDHADEPIDLLFLKGIPTAEFGALWRQNNTVGNAEKPILSGYFSGPLVFHGDIFESTLR